MRRTLGFVMLLGGLLALTGVSMSQQPGGGGKMSKFGTANPDEIFEKYAKGKDAIVLSELDARDQQRLQFLAGMMGITIGERTTREQFKEHFTKVNTMIQSGQLPFKGMGGGTATPPAAPNGAPATPPSGDASRGGPPMKGPPDRDSIMESIFRRMDKNNDGILTADEIPENMQSDRESYDRNHDGFIDLEEFKKFANDRRPPKEGDGNRGGDNNGRPSEQSGTSADRNGKPNPDEVKPTIYRMGNLPKDLPEWFVRLDKAGDCDGQVGLWEARNDKTVLGEFSKYDLNGDGLITAEEILRYKAALAKKSGGGEEVASRDRDRDRNRDPRSSGGGNGTTAMTPATYGYPGYTGVPTPPAPQVVTPPAVGGGFIPPSGGGPPQFGNGFRGFGQGGGSPGFTPSTTPGQGTGFTPRSDGGSNGGGDRPSFGRSPGSGGDSGGNNGFRSMGKGFGRSSNGGNNNSPPKN